MKLLQSTFLLTIIVFSTVSNIHAQEEDYAQDQKA